MAYRKALLPITLSDLQRHSSTSNLFNYDFSYSLAAVAISTENIIKQNWNQFLLVVKATALKTANIKILSANSTLRRWQSHLCQSVACRECKSSVLGICG